MRITQINQQINTNRMNQNASANRSSNVNFGTKFEDLNKAFEIAKDPARFFDNPELKPNITGHPVLKRIVALAEDSNKRIVRLTLEGAQWPKGGTVEPKLRLIPSFENLPPKERAKYLRELEKRQKGKERVLRRVETDPVVDPLQVWGDDVPFDKIDIDNEKFGLFRFRKDNPKYNTVLQADEIRVLPLRVLKATPDIANWLLPKLAPDFLDETEALIIRNLAKEFK